MFTTNGLKGLHWNEEAARKEFEPSHSDSKGTKKEFCDFFFFFFWNILSTFAQTAHTILPLHAPYFNGGSHNAAWKIHSACLPRDTQRHICAYACTHAKPVRLRKASETLESCIHLEVKKKNPGTPPSEPPARLLLSPPLQPQWPQRCGSL